MEIPLFFFCKYSTFKILLDFSILDLLLIFDLINPDLLKDSTFSSGKRGRGKVITYIF